MKPAIAGLALALALCSPAAVRKSFLGLAAPGQNPPPAMGPGHEGSGGMPRGGGEMWWHNPQAAEKLHLTAEQLDKLHKLDQDYHLREIDLRADFEKQETILRSQLESDAPDEATTLAQVEKVSQAQGNLEKARVELVLAARHVLTAEQAHQVRDLQPGPGGSPEGFGPPPGGPNGPEGEGSGGPPPGGPGAPPEGAPGGPPDGGNGGPQAGLAN